MALFDTSQGSNGNGKGNGIFIHPASQAAIWNGKSKQEQDPNYGEPGYVWREDLQKMVPSYMATPSKTVDKPASTAVNPQIERAKATDPNRNNPNYEWSDAQAKYVRKATSPTVDSYADYMSSISTPDAATDSDGRPITETVLGAADLEEKKSTEGEDSFTTDPTTLLPEVVTPSTRELAESYEDLDSKGVTKSPPVPVSPTDTAFEDSETVETAATEDPNEGRAGFYKHPWSGKWETPPPNPFGMGGQFDSTTWKWVNQPWIPKEETDATESSEESTTAPGDLLPEIDEESIDFTRMEVGRRVIEENGRNIQIIEYSNGDVERTDIGESESARIAREENEAAEAKRIEEEKAAADREALMEGYREQALSGELTPEAIRALNLGQGASTALVQLYQQGVEKRNAEEAKFQDNLSKAKAGFLDLAGIEALGLDSAQSMQLVQAYNDGVREREGAAAAVEAERVESEIERYKNILRENPDTDININKIFADDIEVAKALNTWMAGEEYTRLTSGFGMAGDGDASDDDTDLTEETIQSFLKRIPQVPANLGNVEAALWLQDQEGVSPEDVQRWAEWAQQTNRTASVDATPLTVSPTDTEFEDSEPGDTSLPVTVSPSDAAFEDDIPWETSEEEEVVAEETRESFLARMPSVPTDLDNTEAALWLTEQEGVTPEDVQRWSEWANQIGRKATEPVETDEEALARFSQVTDTLPPGTIRTLIQEAGFTEDQVRQAGSLFRLGGEFDFVDGEKAFNGYVEAVQAGTEQEWIQNFEELMANRGYDIGGELITADPLYTFGTPENEAAIAEVDMEELMLRLPEPPVELETPSDKWFWMLDQVDADGNPVLSEIESMAYYKQIKDDWDETNRTTGLKGKGGLGDASDPANLEKIQSTIATEIEKTVQDMGFNSDEYKETQTTALEERYQDARVRLGRQFGIDPGGPKTGRAQRSFEILESQRIQDLSALDSEVQDRVQAARDSTITNLVNAFSSITTGKISEAQLDEQQRQFNTELRESVRQFNKDIAIRLKEFGLNETEVEAAISKINSDIVNNTRAISADISQAWAEVTGELSVPGGTLSLEDLGIPESEWSMFPYLPPSEDMKNSIRMSFEAMLGREMSDGELTNLLANGRIRVEDSMPTQRAKEFAATVMQQNMDRVSKYDAIAEENQLDRDKFTEAKDQADKEWNRLNLQVAEEFGLDSNTFRNSMWDLDQRLSKIFFNEEYTEVERDRARRGAINDVSRAYFPDQQGAFLQAKDQYDVLYGDRERAVANAFGMDAETFARASRQADTQEQRYLDVWTSLLAEVETVKTSVDSLMNRRLNENPEEKQSYLDLARSTPFVGRFVEAIFPKRDVRDAQIDFSWEGDFNKAWLSGIGDAILSVDKMDQVLGPISGNILGIEVSIPAGERLDPDNAIEVFFNHATQTDKDNINEAFNLNLSPGAIQNDDTLRYNLRNYFEAVRAAPEGELPGPFSVSYVPGDWFGRQDTEIQSAIMALLGTTNFSPERSQPGGSALGSIGTLIGAGVGGYIGFKTGGPIGALEGAATGAETVDSIMHHSTHTGN